MPASQLLRSLGARSRARLAVLCHREGGEEPFEPRCVASPRLFFFFSWGGSRRAGGDPCHFCDAKTKSLPGGFVELLERPGGASGIFWDFIFLSSRLPCFTVQKSSLRKLRSLLGNHQNPAQERSGEARGFQAAGGLAGGIRLSWNSPICQYGEPDEGPKRDEFLTAERRFCCI